MVERAGMEAKLGFKAHPHMLRHACGFGLAAKAHDTRALQAYLGHRNIQHAVRYTELSPTRFKGFLEKLRARSYSSCSQSMMTQLSHFRSLGFPIAWDLDPGAVSRD
jgi:integrase